VSGHFFLFWSSRISQLWVWKISPLKYQILQFFPLRNKKNLIELGQKIPRSKMGRPLIYCGSKVCLSQCPSLVVTMCNKYKAGASSTISMGYFFLVKICFFHFHMLFGTLFLCIFCCSERLVVFFIFVEIPFSISIHFRIFFTQPIFHERLASKIDHLIAHTL